MKNLRVQLQVQINEKIYLKDPYSSDLGKKILAESIRLIDSLGLEAFTFRKLAKELGTTESSVYRYFENKHKLLIYLTSWYYGWLEYQLVFSTTNISSAEERLRVAIEVIAKGISYRESIDNFEIDALNRIVVSESSKAYLTKEVDDGNKEGFYGGYKRLVGRISDIALEINPKFENAHTLISTIVEGIHHQKYFADHLPSLTDLEGDTTLLAGFYSDMALAILHKT